MKKILISLILLVGIFIVGFLFIQQNNNTVIENARTTVSEPSPRQNTETETLTAVSLPVTTETNTNRYLNYSEIDYSKERSENTVVLFFYASWCPTCRDLDNDIRTNLSAIPENVRIVRIPYDDISGGTDETLALNKKFNVTYQHTLVQVDENGDQVTKWNGGNTLESLLNKIQ